MKKSLTERSRTVSATLTNQVKKGVKRRIDIEDEQRMLAEEKRTIEYDIVNTLFQEGQTQFLKVDWARLVRSL